MFGPSQTLSHRLTIEKIPPQQGRETISRGTTQIPPESREALKRSIGARPPALLPFRLAAPGRVQGASCCRIRTRHRFSVAQPPLLLPFSADCSAYFVIRNASIGVKGCQATMAYGVKVGVVQAHTVQRPCPAIIPPPLTRRARRLWKTPPPPLKGVRGIPSGIGPCLGDATKPPADPDTSGYGLPLYRSLPVSCI